ncbi:MAG: hypothetical protein LH615_00065, partial [Ferruginibacter sp.]|nr:hypothetical protein [Ferruginibacter sp.]
MKYFLFFLLNIWVLNVSGQKNDFTISNISLPPEIAYYDNQFSGLFVHKEKLYFMSESRLQDKAEAKLYSIAMVDLEHKMLDTSFILPYKKIPIKNLDVLRKKMDAIGDEYEGLEAIVIKGNNVYLTVETTTESDNCYLLKGILNDTAVLLNDKDIMLQPKPITPVGNHVYNAGFEALAVSKNLLFSFFEFNYFPKLNKVNTVQLNSFNRVSLLDFTIKPLPFRITDITATGKNSFTAINFFFKGAGKDEVYRMPINEIENNALIKDSSGYHSYCRLVKIKYKNDSFTWEPLWDFPVEYMSHN